MSVGLVGLTAREHSIVYRKNDLLQTQRYGVSRYANDVIIRPVQNLLQQENRILTSENDELKRNNEDLAKRIEQMMLEFDFNSSPSNRIQDTGLHTFHSSFKYPDVSHRYVEKNNLSSKNHLTNKSQKKHINEMKPLNSEGHHNSYQSSNVSKHQMIRSSENHYEHGFQSSNSSSPRSSPIYVEIFDTEEKAVQYQRNSKLKKTNEKNNSSTDICPKIPINKSERFSYENKRGNDSSNSSTLSENKISNSNNSEYNSKEDILSMSENQKKIIDIINKNSEVLENIYQQQLKLKKNNDMNDDQRNVSQIKPDSSKSVFCQTHAELMNKSTSINKNPEHVCDVNNENGLVLKTLNEQNTKIGSIDEKLTLILNKEERNYVSKNKDHPRQYVTDEVQHESLDIKDNGKLLNKDSKLLNYQVNEHDKDGKSVKRNNEIQNFLEMFNEPEPEIMNLTVNKSMEKCPNEISESTEQNEIMITSKIDRKLESKIENEEITSSFPFPKRSKIPLRIPTPTLPKMKTDNFDQLYSNALESSYETLYDPVFTGRSQDIDENTVNL